MLTFFYFPAAAPALLVGHEILEEAAVHCAAEGHATRHQ
jgi:hypothetical protein